MGNDDSVDDDVLGGSLMLLWSPQRSTYTLLNRMRWSSIKLLLPHTPMPKLQLVSSNVVVQLLEATIT